MYVNVTSVQWKFRDQFNRLQIWLVVWNMIFMTFHVFGIIIPTDFHSYFSEGQVNHQPELSLTSILTVYQQYANHQAVMVFDSQRGRSTTNQQMNADFPSSIQRTSPSHEDTCMACLESFSSHPVSSPKVVVIFAFSFSVSLIMFDYQRAYPS